MSPEARSALKQPKKPVTIEFNPSTSSEKEGHIAKNPDGKDHTESTKPTFDPERRHRHLWEKIAERRQSTKSQRRSLARRISHHRDSRTSLESITHHNNRTRPSRRIDHSPPPHYPNLWISSSSSPDLCECTDNWQAITTRSITSRITNKSSENRDVNPAAQEILGDQLLDVACGTGITSSI